MSPKKPKKEKQKRNLLRSSLFIIGILILAFILFFILTRFFFQKDIAQFKKEMAPLKTSELNLLFFTLDTTRADHLGCYGYNLIETPNIDSLAKNGILFKNATCQVPLTLPSHSSIFTGTYPFFHGVRDNGGFYLDEEQVTFAEVLKDNGWATSAFIGAFVLDSRWGLDQGFDYYYDNFDFAKYKTISLDTVQRNGGEVREAFFDWFQKNQHKKFFSWIHLYDPHTPYDPPEPYKTKYSERPWGLYDGEIAYVDVIVGNVLEELKKNNLMEKTIIVIVGDHGESLGEHYESSHGFFIYDACVSVPLIIQIPSPKIRGKTITSQVRLVDIMPTLLEILDLPLPQEVQGKSFIRQILGKSPREESFAYSESYFPRYHFGWSELKSLRTSEYKYIQAPKPELYDLRSDPDENYNLYPQNLALGRKFERELETLQEKMAAKGIEEKGPEKVDDEAREKLAALGYIGGFTSSSKLSQSQTLGDPKDKIILYNKIKMAEGASSNEKLDEALALLNEVIKQDPMIIEARQVRAQVFLKLNRVEEAIQECQEALKIDPEYEAAIFSLAQAYIEAKKDDEALAGFERLSQLDPRDPKPHYNMGGIYLRKKDLNKAIFHLEQSIRLDPEHSAQAHNLLGAAHLENKNLEQAEQEIRKALEMRPQVPDAHFNLALLYEEKGELGQAIEEYKKELEIHPAAFPSHFNLAKLYGKMGDLSKGIEHFKEAIKVKKDFANGFLFLAKAYLDLGENFGEAISLAQEGLRLEPESEYAPLGHYILADIYNRLGRRKESLSELQKGKELEQRIKRNG